MDVPLNSALAVERIDSPDRLSWGGAAGAARIFAGAVLIFAAILKAYETLSSPPAALGITTFGIISAEWLVGVWLISGIARRASWTVAILSFSAFTIYNLVRALSGFESCGCFGRVEIHPWYTAALDACIASMLFIHPPQPSMVTTALIHPPRFALGALAFGLVGLVALAAAWPRETSLPANGLISDSYTHDFGLLTPAKAARAEHIFTLRNTSDRPIRVLRSTSTCGCTVAEASKEPVAPGGSLKVTVTADWSKRSGEQVEQVRLITDYSKTGKVNLAIRGTIEQTGFLSPTAIHFGAVERGHPVHRTIRIGSPQRGSLQITSVDISNDLFSVIRIDGSGKAEPTVPLTGPSGRFLITFACQDCTGSHSGTITFHTNTVGSPRQTLTVTAHVAAPVEVMPPSLLFTAAEIGQTKMLRVLARTPDTHDVPTLRVVPGSDSSALIEVLTAERIASPDSAIWIYGVRLSEAKATSALRRIRLRVSVGSEEIDVPLIILSPNAQP